MLLVLYVVNKNLNIEGVFVWYVIYIYELVLFLGKVDIRVEVISFDGKVI